jgi:adenylate cyclase
MGAGTTGLSLARRRAGAPGAPAPAEGARLAHMVGRRVRLAQTAASVLGAIDVFLLLWLVLPDPHGHTVSDRTLLLVNAGALAVLGPIALLVSLRWADSAFRPVRRWLESGRAPTAEERRAALRIPLRSAGISAADWAAAAVVFCLLNLPFSLEVAWHVGSTIVLGGITCVALGYLLAERLTRPITARALAHGAPAPQRPGVNGRLVLTWALATGSPLLGLGLLGLHTLIEPGETTVEELAWSIVVLATLAILAGLGATVLSAKSVSEPLGALRRAMGRVEEGDLGARVEVDDASEVGLLQSRFNAMAAGLAEREELRDLFGRHVGEDVVREALSGDGTQLGGEVRDVAVLFADLIGSTSLAVRRPPREVVALLNEFFAVVVDVAGRHGGWVNKFEGDAALVVFGAPASHPDAAGAALAAARDLRRALEALPVDAGVGVSAGPAVAGNVGAEERFEYTVIGDPVNEAARLCDLAKRRGDRVLAAARAVEAARDGEAARWSLADAVVLRGRETPTRVAAPVARQRRAG